MANFDVTPLLCIPTSPPPSLFLLTSPCHTAVSHGHLVINATTFTVRNGHTPKACLKLWQFIKLLGMLATLRIRRFTFLTVLTCHGNNYGYNCATGALNKIVCAAASRRNLARGYNYNPCMKPYILPREVLQRDCSTRNKY